MRILFFVICLFSASVAFSQNVVPRSTGSTTVEDARLFAGKNFGLPQYIDTTEANLTSNIGVDSAGTLIFTYTGNNIWKRSLNPKRWELVSSQPDPYSVMLLSANNNRWKISVTNSGQIIATSLDIPAGALYTTEGTLLYTTEGQVITTN